ncbi:ArsR family transcriptional regulator, partial [Xanthomonas oryzae pv. oryzae]
VNLGFAAKELRKFAEKAGLDVSSLETVTREKRPPHFEVISLIAMKPGMGSRDSGLVENKDTAARRTGP